MKDTVKRYNSKVITINAFHAWSAMLTLDVAVANFK